MASSCRPVRDNAKARLTNSGLFAAERFALVCCDVLLPELDRLLGASELRQHAHVGPRHAPEIRMAAGHRALDAGAEHGQCAFEVALQLAVTRAAVDQHGHPAGMLAREQLDLAQRFFHSRQVAGFGVGIEGEARARAEVAFAHAVLQREQLGAALALARFDRVALGQVQGRADAPGVDPQLAIGFERLR